MKKNMNKSALLFMSLPFWVLGQNTEELGAVVQTARAQINLAEGRLSEATSAENVRLELQYGELSVFYQLPELGEEGRFYEVEPAIRLNGRELLLVPSEEFRGDWGRPLTPGARRLLWIDLPARYIQLQGELEMVLTVRRWGERKLPYDCSLGEPRFTARQRLPYYLAAGLGAAAIGAGQIFREQSQRIYDRDYSNSETLEEASPLYEDANNKHHTYLILTYAGAGVLAADAALYLIRRRRYKKNMEWYEQYCRENSLSFRPAAEWPSAGKEASVGLKMTWTF